VTGEEEEGAAEAVVESVLRPKRSLWRRMVSAGLAIFGVSVVAQGVQWTANAWQTQDWIALGGCVAGALIVGRRRIGGHRVAPPVATAPARPRTR
jgi:putative membrane protein